MDRVRHEEHTGDLLPQLCDELCRDDIVAREHDCVDTFGLPTLDKAVELMLALVPSSPSTATVLPDSPGVVALSITAWVSS